IRCYLSFLYDLKKQWGPTNFSLFFPIIQLRFFALSTIRCIHLCAEIFQNQWGKAIISQKKLIDYLICDTFLLNSLGKYDFQHEKPGLNSANQQWNSYF